MSSQKITLQVAETQFGSGEKLLENEMYELGLEENTPHTRIEFDNGKTRNYKNLDLFFNLSCFH